MNTLINMNPWRFLDDLLDADSRVFKSIRARAAGRFPPVNVMMDDNAVLLDVELPGKSAADVELTLEPQAVVIADKPAEKPAETPAEKDECQCTWRRRIELPFRVCADKANAKFVNGILRIELPKADEAQKHRIAIGE